MQDSNAETSRKELEELKFELQQLQISLNREREVQAALSMRIETHNSSLSVQKRGVRATKMKMRELQEQERQLLHWFKVNAKVSYDKGKDHANLLLQKAMTKISKVIAINKTYSEKLEAIHHESTIKRTEFNHLISDKLNLQKTKESIERDLVRMNNQAIEDEKILLVRRSQFEADMQIKIKAEEDLIQFEQKLLLEAREKQSPGRPVQIYELEEFSVKMKDLTRVSREI